VLTLCSPIAGTIGDCRSVVTAIRRGRLADALQADRDALVMRFEQVTAERYGWKWAQQEPNYPGILRKN
jgi:hypothetical protein